MRGCVRSKCDSRHDQHISGRARGNVVHVHKSEPTAQVTVRVPTGPFGYSDPSNRRRVGIILRFVTIFVVRSRSKAEPTIHPAAHAHASTAATLAAFGFIRLFATTRGSWPRRRRRVRALRGSWILLDGLGKRCCRCIVLQLRQGLAGLAPSERRGKGRGLFGSVRQKLALKARMWLRNPLARGSLSNASESSR